MTPHIIRECNIVKVRDLKVGQIFYIDLDNFMFFFSTNKRYVDRFVEGKAVVQNLHQILHQNGDKSYDFNVKTYYELDDEVYVLAGEHVSIF